MTLSGESWAKEPFQQAHYLLLNLAIGGTNGGDPSSTAFPNHFEIDYVRIYQNSSLKKHL